MRTLRYRQIVYNNVHSAAQCVRKINEILKNYNHNYELGFSSIKSTIEDNL